MGKPYANELELLSRTYSWAMEADVEGLATALQTSLSDPLIAIGSGGSLTSAHLAAYLHSLYGGNLSRAMTPYELASSPVHLGRVGLLLLTAGGSNPDVLGCFSSSLARGPKHFNLLCTRSRTPLSELVADSNGVALHEFDLPGVKDGFLATNSLLATSVLLARSYAFQAVDSSSLPKNFGDLVHPGSNPEEFVACLSELLQPLLPRTTLVVLHGHETLPAAIDIESKFTEAAIGHVQIADYRNFAHGRHHWLARNAPSTAVLSLAGDDDLDVARKTLSLLPKDIPVAQFKFGSGVQAGIRSIVLSLYIAGRFATARGIDPGRPTVPLFGRKLYHLGGSYRGRSKLEVPEQEALAITRKAGAGISTLKARGQLAGWREAYTAFLHRLNRARFCAVVLDYDGTLCDAHERYVGIGQEITDQLLMLLRANIRVGIATGRGQSVRTDLRNRISDRSLMARLLIGYHNGAEIGFLDDDSQPSPTKTLDSSLVEIHELLRSDPLIAPLVRIEAARRQVTLEYKSCFAEERVWESVQQLLSRATSSGITAVRSSHSVDILAPSTSKLSVVEKLRQLPGFSSISGSILCIGDRGRWPGNDFALLQEPYSLSVDEVSGDPSTCWNLATPRARFAGALLEYFRNIKLHDGNFSIHF